MAANTEIGKPESLTLTRLGTIKMFSWLANVRDRFFKVLKSEVQGGFWQIEKWD